MSGLMARILPADSHSPPTAARSSHIFSYLDTIIFKSLCWESVSVEKSPRALRIAHFIISTPNESSVLQSSPSRHAGDELSDSAKAKSAAPSIAEKS